MSTGQRINECRVSAGLTAEELGTRIGKNRATVYRYESDDIDIPLSIIAKIAEVCGVNPAYLMGWSEQRYFYSAEEVRNIVAEGAEKRLIEYYRSLNPDGQDRLLKYAGFLASDPSLIQSPPGSSSKHK